MSINTPKISVINFASSNKNKLKELQYIFREHLINIEIRQFNIDLPEVQGEPEDVVKFKLEFAIKNANNLDGAILVEDTSLGFNAYGGLPGVYIKYFLDKIKPEGLYKMASAFDDHCGYAQSIYGLQNNINEPPKIFIGKTDGEIVQPRGNNSFGWDSCFQPKGYTKTYAEMEEKEKNLISHRSKSTKLMIDWLKSQIN